MHSLSALSVMVNLVGDPILVEINRPRQC